MSPRERVSNAIRALAPSRVRESPTVKFFVAAGRLSKHGWLALMVVVKAWTVRSAALGLLGLVVEDVENTHALQKLAIEKGQLLTPVSALDAIHWSVIVVAITALFGEEEFRELVKRLTFVIGLKAGYERQDVNVNQRTEILDRRVTAPDGNAFEST